jgi:phosphate transport system protein
VTLHLQKDLESLKRRILEMGQIVAERARDAVHALLHQDASAARRVIDGDDDIDQREVAIEEEALKILALHQPVATDLRWVIAVLKVNSDLERVGDLAVNIAERAAFLATRPPIGIRLDFDRMGEMALGMLNNCLRSIVDLDVPLARRVIVSDQEVDEMNKEMFVAIQERMVQDPSVIQRAIHYLSASRHLERIGDHATNIAEDVVFLVEGTVIRHQHEEYSQDE